MTSTTEYRLDKLVLASKAAADRLAKMKQAERRMGILALFFAANGLIGWLAFGFSLLK